MLRCTTSNPRANTNDMAWLFQRQWTQEGEQACDASGNVTEVWDPVLGPATGSFGSHRVGLSYEPTAGVAQNPTSHLYTEMVFGVATFRLPQLDGSGLTPDDVASAKAMVSVGGPVETIWTYVCDFHDTDPGLGIWVEDEGKWWAITGSTQINTTISATVHMFGLFLEPPDGYRAGVLSSMQANPSTFSDNVAVKCDMTAVVKAYLSAETAVRKFGFYLVPGEGVALPPDYDGSDIASTMSQVRSLCYENNLHYELHNYTGGGDYEMFAIGSVVSRKIEWGGITCGEIWVTLANGLEIPVQLHYGVPCAF